jgi:small subunit ribosomal protein S17
MASQEVIGVVVSDKMAKTVVVAIERQIRHDVYGKAQRLTSKFTAHDESNEVRSATRSRSSRAGRSAAASGGS